MWAFSSVTSLHGGAFHELSPLGSGHRRMFCRVRGAVPLSCFWLPCGTAGGHASLTHPSSGPLEQACSAFPSLATRETPPEVPGLPCTQAVSRGVCQPRTGTPWEAGVNPSLPHPSQQGLLGQDLARGELLCFKALFHAVCTQRASPVLF